MQFNQTDLLKDSLQRLDPDGKSDNPFVKGLQQQIANAEKPRADNPVVMSAGMASVPARAQDNLPPAPSRADFPTQEAFEEAQGGWQARVGRIKGLAGVSEKT